MINFQRFSARVSSLAVMAVSATLLSAPALAGFEWTPPLKIVTSTDADGALMPEMPAIPRDSIETIEMSAPPPAPPVADDSAMARPTPPVMEQVSTPPVMMDEPAPVAVVEEAQARVEVASIPSPYAETMGFGADIPLALAMRQIVPPEYAFQFDPSVDQGARISWDGGKPWNDVLRDAVSPVGLDVNVTADTVHVFPQGMMPSAPMLIEPEMTATTMPVQTPEPVREVYIRRNSDGEPVEHERAPGTSVESMPKKQSSFWSHFGLKAPKSKTTVRNTAVVADRNTPDALPATIKLETPAPAPAEMTSGMNEPMSLTQPPAENMQQMSAADTLDFWHAEKGDSLRNVLQTWSENAGVQLFWVPTADYMVPDGIRLKGSYTEAVTEVLSAYGDQGPRPVGRLHPNLPTGPSVLIIEPANG